MAITEADYDARLREIQARDKEIREAAYKADKASYDVTWHLGADLDKAFEDGLASVNGLTRAEIEQKIRDEKATYAPIAASFGAQMREIEEEYRALDAEEIL